MSGTCPYGNRGLAYEGSSEDDSEQHEEEFYHAYYSRSNLAVLDDEQSSSTFNIADREEKDERIVPEVNRTLDGAQMKYLREKTAPLDFVVVLPLLRRLNFDVEKVVQFCKTQPLSEYVCDCTTTILKASKEALAFGEYEVKRLGKYTECCDNPQIGCTRKMAMSHWCIENGVEEEEQLDDRRYGMRRSYRTVLYSREYQAELRARNDLRIEEMTRRQLEIQERAIQRAILRSFVRERCERPVDKTAEIIQPPAIGQACCSMENLSNSPDREMNQQIEEQWFDTENRNAEIENVDKDSEFPFSIDNRTMESQTYEGTHSADESVVSEEQFAQPIEGQVECIELSDDEENNDIQIISEETLSTEIYQGVACYVEIETDIPLDLARDFIENVIFEGLDNSAWEEFLAYVQEVEANAVEIDGRIELIFKMY